MPTKISTTADDSAAVSSRTRKRATSTNSPEARPKRARTRDSNVATTSAPGPSTGLGTGVTKLRKTRRKQRSVKGKEKATLSEQEEDAVVAPGPLSDSQQVDEYLATSPSQVSNESGTSSKTVTSTTSLESEDSALAKLQKELTAKDELLRKQATTFSSLQNILQCQICLEMLWRPYSLTPCGHVACESCLIAWFSQPSQAEAEMEFPILLPHLRKKICPTCRTEVRSRPVVAYLIKSALHAVLPSLDPSSYDASGAIDAADRPNDPWKGIFPESLSADEERRRNNMNFGHPHVIIDDEDGGVPRCPECLHEIFDEVCTGCGHVFVGLSDNEDDDDVHDHGDFGAPYAYGGLDFIGMPGWPYGDEGAGNGEEDDALFSDPGYDESYESDFINDDVEGDSGPPLYLRRYRGAVGDPYGPPPSPPPRAGPSRRRPRAVEYQYPTSSEDSDHASASRSVRSTSSSPSRGGVLGLRGSVNSNRAVVSTASRSSHAPDAIIDLSDSAESDWAPRPRHERLAEQERERQRRARQTTTTVDTSDEEEGHIGVGIAYVSSDEDDEAVVAPGARRRRGGRRVVNVVTSDDEDEASGDEVFEDAVSSAEVTAPSEGHQSPRRRWSVPYRLPTEDEDEDDDDEPPRSHLRVRSRWDDDDDDDERLRWGSDHFDEDTAPSSRQYYEDMDSGGSVDGSQHFSDESF